MSQIHQERMWYLSKYYGRGGWHSPMMTHTKKWQTCFDRLLKDGCLEKDPEYDVYRITDRGREALKGAG